MKVEGREDRAVRRILLALLLLVPVFAVPGVVNDFDHPKWAVLVAGTGAALAVVLVRALRRGDEVRVVVPEHLSALALLAPAALLLAPRAPDGRATVLAWSLIGTLAAFGLLATRYFRDWRQARRALTALAVSGGAAALLGLGQILAGREHPSSTFGNPTFAAEFLAPLLVVLVPLFLMGRRTVAVAAGIPVAAFLAGLFLAGRARADLLGLGAGLAALALLEGLARLRRRPPARAVAAVLLAGILAAPFLVDLLPAGLTGRPETVEVRRHLRAAAFAMAAERPLTGYGLEGFAAEYPARRDPGEFRISMGRRVGFAHHLPGQAAAEAGFPGLLALLLFVWVPLRSAVASFLADRGDGLAIAAAGGMTAVLTSAQFSAPLRHPASALVFFLLAALAVACRRRRYVTDLVRRHRRAMPVFLMLVPVLAGAVGLARHLTADALLRSALDRARSLEGGLDERGVARLRASLRFRPLPEALRLIAFHEAGTGDPDAALGTLRELFRISPHDELGRVEQARALLAAGATRAALDELDRLVAARPGDDLVLRLRARAHRAAGDPARELADWLAALREARPELAGEIAREVSARAPEHVLAVSRAAERMGATDPARALAVLSGLESPEAVYLTAVLRAAAGDLDEAMRALRRAAAEGAADRDRLRYDPRLDPLRGRADFRALLGGR